MRKIPRGNLIAVDTETTGLYPWKGDRPFIVTFCNEEGETGIIRCEVDPFTRKVNWHHAVHQREWEEMFLFFTDPKITKIFFNAKFDIRMIEHINPKLMKVNGRIEDVFFMSKILRANEPSHGLKPLARKYLGIPDDDQKELQKAVIRARHQGKKLGWKLAEEAAADYWTAPVALQEKYAIQDAERTMLLYKILEPELDTAPAYRKFRKFYEREMELLPITKAMEDRGVRVKLPVIEEEIRKNERIMNERHQELCKHAGEDFNPNSPPHVIEFVYKKLGHPVREYTDKGNPSVDLEALAGLNDPLVRLIQEYKASQKAISSFFQKFKDLAVQAEDGHHTIYPNFNQVGPITGRFSCNNPNLQNVANATSVKAVAPIQARVSFWPRVGYEWYCFDYSAQEAWIFAAGAQERKMLDILLADRDLPGETAVAIWGKNIVDAETKRTGDSKKNLYRIRAKMLLYGLIYGIGEAKLGDLLNIPRMEAREVKERYLTLFPEIERFMQDTIKSARRKGYVATAWGRRIPVESDTAYRAVNYFVQGSAADIMKQAMLDIHKWLQTVKIDAHLLMTVHDELIMEFNKTCARKEHILKVKSIMENHKGHLKGIPCLPAGIARVTKSWNMTEKVTF